jgi:hypothetical protein
LRTFLITLVASVVLSVMPWNFRIAHRIWPAHPLLATTLIAAICASAVQTVLRRDEAAQKSK